MKLFTTSKPFTEHNFKLEEDFEKEVVLLSKQFFGSNTIFIDVKRKIDTKGLGGSIPDGFMFDLTDIQNPEFYLVEVELQKHDFFNHIFPQITKFFAFFKNAKSRSELVEKIFSTINTDPDLKKEFKKYLGEKEVYKFLVDTIQQSQNILLIIDGDKRELPEIMETYSDTWGKMVKKIILKKFSNKDEWIYTMDPEFENIEFATLADSSSDPILPTEYTEDDHINNINEDLQNAYLTIKNSILKEFPEVIFNVQKYYISIRLKKSLAFFEFRKKKIYLVVIYPENETRSILKHHKIKTLTESVQKFWNGESCAVILENSNELNEVINLLKKIIQKAFV